MRQTTKYKPVLLNYPCHCVLPEAAFEDLHCQYSTTQEQKLTY